jgi:hypothetical protein
VWTEEAFHKVFSVCWSINSLDSPFSEVAGSLATKERMGAREAVKLSIRRSRVPENIERDF